jgi:tetratricopeptide (TPR) repeat protein
MDMVRFDSRSLLRTAFSLAVLSFCLLTAAKATIAQGTVPREDYDAARIDYWEGDVLEAVRSFRQGQKSSLNFGGVYWVDSLCYYTMVGECLYQLGNYQDSLAAHTAALEIYLAYPDWLASATFPPTISPISTIPRHAPTWGPSKRKVVIGSFPRRYNVIMVNTGVTSVTGNTGGATSAIISQPTAIGVRVDEVLRCTAISLRRRRELLGPCSRHDAVFRNMSAALARPNVPAGTWPQGWVKILLGLSLAGEGRRDEALAELRGGAVIGGIDHPLSATAWLEAGKLLLEAGAYGDAESMCFEATFPATYFEQFDELEEAFRIGTIAHIGMRDAVAPAALPLAIAWADRNGSAQLRASLRICAAELQNEFGSPATAANLLDQVANGFGRKQFMTGPIGARQKYEASRSVIAQGNGAASLAALTAAVGQQQKMSLRAFQAATADQLVVSGSVRQQAILELYAELLHEPTEAEWRLAPLETMAFWTTPQLPRFNRWYLAAVGLGDDRSALQIADLSRRVRFNQLMPMAGKIMSLRYLLTGPEDWLTENQLDWRRQFLARNPQLMELSKVADGLATDLRLRSFTDEKDQEAVGRALAGLAECSATQEAILSRTAVLREGAQAAFPPVIWDQAAFQKGLAEDTLVLHFFVSSEGIHANAIRKNYTDVWRVPQPAGVRVRVAALLKAIGNSGPNTSVKEETLLSDAWRQMSTELFAQLTKGQQRSDEIWKGVKELLIVPDGFLWYLPFEMLIDGKQDAEKTLLERYRIRYSPTVGLAFPDPRKAGELGRTFVSVGKMTAKEDETVADGVFEEFKKAVPDVERLKSPLPASSGLLSSVADRLVILDDAQELAAGLAWRPMVNDKGKAGSMLGDWLGYPIGGPEQVIFTGVHTPAAAGLKGGAAGDEIFIAVTGMMGSGARTVLMSRWRTGGQTSIDLSREFLQELPSSTASAAWRRGVEIVGEAHIAPAREPRLDPAKISQTLSPKHPFWWAGYLLVDTGIDPARPAEGDKPPVAEAGAVPGVKPDGKMENPEGKNQDNGDEKNEAEPRKPSE